MDIYFFCTNLLQLNQRKNFRGELKGTLNHKQLNKIVYNNPPT